MSTEPAITLVNAVCGVRGMYSTLIRPNTAAATALQLSMSKPVRTPAASIMLNGGAWLVMPHTSTPRLRTLSRVSAAAEPAQAIITANPPMTPRRRRTLCACLRSCTSTWLAAANSCNILIAMNLEGQ